MQAGVKNITLYENKDLSFRYHDPADRNKISAIVTGGETIEVLNCQRPIFRFEAITNMNNRIGFAYEISFFLFELTLETLGYVETLKESIYGWKALIEFYDNTYKFYNVPLFCADAVPIDIADSMAFDVGLATRVNSPVKHLNFETAADLGYKADTTLISADTTLFTADYTF